MEYEGGFIKDPRKLYQQLKHQIPYHKRKSYDESFEYELTINEGMFLDEKGNFKHDIDYNSKNMSGPESIYSTKHKRILKFIETQDLSVLFKLK